MKNMKKKNWIIPLPPRRNQPSGQPQFSRGASVGFGTADQDKTWCDAGVGFNVFPLPFLSPMPYV